MVRKRAKKKHLAAQPNRKIKRETSKKFLFLWFNKYMNLVKEIWTKKDLSDLQAYLLSFSKGEESASWEKRIINTEMACLAVPSLIVKKITNKIAKGNYMSYLDLWAWDNMTIVFINGGLIVKIKDFDLMVKYLTNYLLRVDNWAAVDTLKFKIDNNNKKAYYSLAKQFITSDKPFVRRAGLLIMMKLVDEDELIDDIFASMNLFYNETHYYVNMMIAWLFAECFTKQRSKSLAFLKTHKLNKFTINKGISKCRDSFRVSQEDKEMLVKYRIT